MDESGRDSRQLHTGKLALPISYIASGYGQFAVNHNCGGSVAVGASCTFTVAFAPRYAGDIYEYLYAYDGSGSNEYMFLLRARGGTLDTVRTYGVRPGLGVEHE